MDYEAVNPQAYNEIFADKGVRIIQLEKKCTTTNALEQQIPVGKKTTAKHQHCLLSDTIYK